jgi:hypothetical protein
MDITFTGLYYLMHTLILDLFIAIQFLAINIMQRHPFKYQKFNALTSLGKVCIFAFINLIAIGLLYLLEELYLSFLILSGELIIVCLVAGTILIIVYSV